MFLAKQLGKENVSAKIFLLKKTQTSWILNLRQSFDHPRAFESEVLRWALKILGIGSLEFIRM